MCFNTYMTSIIPTQEERRLLDLLTDVQWQQHVLGRGIPPVTVQKTELTQSGIECLMKLEQKSTLELLVRAMPMIRAVLDVEDDTMTTILPGGRGSIVRLAVRTRLVTDTFDMHWHPGIDSLGIDTVTGEEIFIPPETHMLFSGTTGSGKSWSTRPVMARAVVNDWDVLLADPKVDESNIWGDVIRTATSADEIADMVELVSSRFAKNTQIMKEAGVSSWNDSLGKRTLFVADEGRETLNYLSDMDELLTRLAKESGEYDPMQPSLRRRLVNVSAKARSKGIILLWATQYPIVSEGKSGAGGLDNGINPNLNFRFSLRVASKQHAQQALEDTMRYPAHEIPEGMAGHGYAMNRKPNLIRTWTVTDEMVKNLRNVPKISTPLQPGRDISAYTPLDAARLATRKGGLWTPSGLSSETGCTTMQAAKLLETLMRNGEAVRRGNGYVYNVA